MTSLFSQDVPAQLEALYNTSDIATQRQVTLTALCPRPGEHILDIGSGPGQLTLQIAEKVAPTGRVTGIDISPDMIKFAQTRREETTAGQYAHFQKGDAASLPFADATFDAAVSTQVYEYVNALTQALHELYRVLRPGGRAVIVDTDWDSTIWHTDNPSLTTQVMNTWKSRFTDPYLPRTLRRRLHDAGFITQQTIPLTILNTEYTDTTYSVRHLPIMVPFLIHKGLSESTITTWIEDLKRQGHQATYFFSLNRYLFLTTKP
jgi:ubiquinone/menaquinone biosynthesis C-methylase UbiE